ncbi:GDP-fucose protein O-fucosyltransferase family protein [Pseudohyphozyma bogoriensis]|nr:GDP-fucose protein O-fucosyltransferase family protein [Pseudohyphozyma bogoriensis]
MSHSRGAYAPLSLHSPSIDNDDLIVYPPKRLATSSRRRWTTYLLLAVALGFVVESARFAYRNDAAVTASNWWKDKQLFGATSDASTGVAGTVNEAASTLHSHPGAERPAMMDHTQHDASDSSTENAGIAPSVSTVDVEEPSVDPALAEQPIAKPATESAPSSESRARVVHPIPRPPPPPTSPPTRYLAYESHSGFHNQRVALANAMVLAHILDRTLLVPPARLGRPQGWGPAPGLQDQLTADELCKIEVDDSVERNCTANDWTYVGWEFLIRPEVLTKVPIVDRWNSSQAWFETPREQGGLGVTPGSVKTFDDPQRRSIKFFDQRNTRTSLARWGERIDLEDLIEGGDKDIEVLHFGSLFSGSRLSLRTEENRKFLKSVEWGFVLGHPETDRIGNLVASRLGKYNGVHLRVGDAFFKTQARDNMKHVYEQFCLALGFESAQVDALFADAVAAGPTEPEPTHHRRPPAKSKSKAKEGVASQEESPKVNPPVEKPAPPAMDPASAEPPTEPSPSDPLEDPSAGAPANDSPSIDSATPADSPPPVAGADRAPPPPADDVASTSEVAPLEPAPPSAPAPPTSDDSADASSPADPLPAATTPDPLDNDVPTPEIASAPAPAPPTAPAPPSEPAPPSQPVPALAQEAPAPHLGDFDDRARRFSRRQRRSFDLHARADPASAAPSNELSLICRGTLHTEPHLLALNTPLYIATDSVAPREDPLLAHFFYTWPCAFTLSDFPEAVQEELVSDWDGSRVDPYLVPFIDASIAAKGEITMGTPRSTFSAYAAGILHSTYAAEKMGVPVEPVVIHEVEVDDELGFR